MRPALLRSAGEFWPALSCATLLLAVGLSSCEPATQAAEKAPAKAPPAAAPLKPNPERDLWVGTGADRLAIHTYYSTVPAVQPRLVVVLHGDAPFTKPGYQYGVAKQVAAATDSVVAIGLLRPGYTDPDGRQSAGERGEATGDNYTPAVVDAVAGAIRKLRDAHHASKVVLVGHSGGAAIAANVLGRHPGLADAAVLVSCPCDVPRWRSHMQQLQDGAPIWARPVQSLSPTDLVPRIPVGTQVHLLVGSNDPVTPPRFSDDYARLLRQGGLTTVRLTQVPDQGHELLQHPAVLQSIQAVLR